VPHDRIHAREPTQDPENWREGVVERAEERDGHWVVTVDAGGERVELTTTLAIRDLVTSRLPDPSPVGQRVWFRQRGG
jgi:hypothetical protein